MYYYVYYTHIYACIFVNGKLKFLFKNINNFYFNAIHSKFNELPHFLAAECIVSIFLVLWESTVHSE